MSSIRDDKEGDLDYVPKYDARFSKPRRPAPARVALAPVVSEPLVASPSEAVAALQGTLDFSSAEMEPDEEVEELTMTIPELIAATKKILQDARKANDPTRKHHNKAS